MWCFAKLIGLGRLGITTTIIGLYTCCSSVDNLLDSAPTNERPVSNLIIRTTP